MNSIVRFVPAALVALAPAAAFADGWQIDGAHTSAQFSVKHMMVSTVRGELGKVSGTVELDPKNPTKASIDATIDVGGLSTREPKRDEHLKSDDFFNAVKFPTIHFKSTKVVAAGKNHYKVTGNLTIRDNTRPVVLDVEGPSPEVTGFGMTHVGFMATTKLSRKDFGLKWNKMIEAGPVVADEVDVLLDVDLAKPAQQSAKK